MNGLSIVTVSGKRAKILTKKIAPFSVSSYGAAPLRNLVRAMRAKMKEAEGVGLSANQVGFDLRLFVAEVPSDKGRAKFYAIANPEIVKSSKETETLEEGCLASPGCSGMCRAAKELLFTVLT